MVLQLRSIQTKQHLSQTLKSEGGSSVHVCVVLCVCAHLVGIIRECSWDLDDGCMVLWSY